MFHDLARMPTSFAGQHDKWDCALWRQGGSVVVDWLNIIAVLSGPAVAIVALIVSRRDRLADAVNELARCIGLLEQRVARIEGHLHVGAELPPEQR